MARRVRYGGHYGVRPGRISKGASKQGVGGSPMGSSDCIVDPHGAARAYGRMISEALDPVRAPSKVRSFADMTPEEQAAMRAQYSR